MGVLLSVIVPIYKVEPYLRECVDSIIAQKLPDMEIILVDDGSPDQCPLICDEYEKKDSRIRVIHKKNGGLVNARKDGARISSGKYITFVDSDDWIEPGMYEAMSHLAEKTNADVIVTDCYQDQGEKLIRYRTKLPEGLYTDEKMCELQKKMMYSGKFYHPGIYPSVWNKWFKREILIPNLEAIDERISLGEDMACTYACLLDASSVMIYKEKCFYHYRWREESMINQYDAAYIQKFVWLYEYLEKCFSEKNRKDILQQVCYHRLYTTLIGLIEECKGGRKDFHIFYRNRTVRKIWEDIPVKEMNIPVIYKSVYKLLAEHRTKALPLFVFFMRVWMKFFWL